MPNVGKSTLFNALTKAEIAAENYPFCTIDPNVGVVAVPDKRLDELAKIVKPERVYPTTMEFVDIAGLVAGASKGEGLGNKFLANIRETDAIAHVVRCFENDDIVHVAGAVNPLDDMETINLELLLADMEVVEKALEKAKRSAKSGSKESILRAAVLAKAQAHIEQDKPLRTLELNEKEQAVLADYSFLTAKAMMYIANVNDDGFSDNPLLDALEQQVVREGVAQIVPVCAAMEAEIALLEDDEKLEFLADMGLSESGLDRVINAGYQLLGLQTFFTAGVKEVRAWTVEKGATAPNGAGKIHTDFEKGFIRAEVIAYDDFIACAGEQGAKDSGKWRLEGKDYILAEADVVHFRFNV